MNWPLVISGLFAGFTTVGHFTMGSKMYLQPMMQADFDPVAKKIMHSVFHYVSVFLILSSAALLALGFGITFSLDEMLVKFIAFNYAGFAVTQISLALTSDIEKSLFKMFQWTFFVLIATFAWLGA